MDKEYRFIRTMGAMWGAEMEEPEPRRRNSDGPPKEKKEALPAYAIDPSRGGEATPLYGEQQIFELPINLGYEIIDNSQ